MTGVNVFKWTGANMREAQEFLADERYDLTTPLPRQPLQVQDRETLQILVVPPGDEILIDKDGYIFHDANR
jgi:hypothetical protein